MATDAQYTAADQHSSFPMDSWVREGNGSFGGEPTLLVVDPATRKLCIPVSAVLQTQALMRLDRVPSICMLYLQGRCRQGMHCHQLHADPQVVDMLRAEVSMRTSCCPAHGEEVSQPALPQLAPEVECVVVDGMRIDAARIATTNGMRRIVDDRPASSKSDANFNSITIQRAQVCRLHVLGRCRYAEDCNFVHLCRGLCDGEDPSLGKLINTLAASTPNKAGRPFGRQFGTPSSAFVPQMPPSPLYAGAPRTPSYPAEGFPSLDHNEDSHGTTPPSSPAREASGSITTPVSGPWRHEPYSWACVSPVKAMAS